ncbi:ATP-binding cassette domain-containing protein [Curtobacterium flaccumfaciens]|nr:ATP-binding cassette domain-containing protein [Curtobacterium flaccumfaciens]
MSIQAGSTVGLIGQNGSGKSTLLKAIGGIIQPTSGTVSRRGRLAALLELGAGFHPRPVRPRERVPQREPARPQPQADRREVRRHPGVLGHRGLHRHPGEVLLIGHVRAARLRRRRAHRPRRAARRRGPGGR